MELLKQAVPLLIPLSLAALVFVIGLEATVEDLLYLFKRPRRLAWAFVAICVVVPVVAAWVVVVLPLHPVSRAGIVIMAVAPLPPLAPGKQLKYGGRKAYVYGLYTAFALLAVITVPVTIGILGDIYGKDVSVSALTLAKTVLLSVLLPLAFGMAIQAFRPRLAAAAAPWVGRASMLLLGVLCIPLAINALPAMESVVGDGTLMAIMLISVSGLIAGHLLGGPEHADRVALALAAATRHPGIALMIANANVQDRRVSAVILLFLLVSLVIAIPYRFIAKPRRRPRPPWTAPGPAAGGAS